MSILGSLLKGNSEEHKKKLAEKRARIKKRNEQKKEYRKQKRDRVAARHKKRKTGVENNIKVNEINTESD